MDEMHRESPNKKFNENEDDEHIKENSDGDNERESETSDKSVHVVGTTSTKTDSSRGLKTNDDDFKMERHRISKERVDFNFDNHPDDTKIERKIESKSLNEYLNEHERFLKSIDRKKQLSLYEQKQLDRQKEDLKKFQTKLAKQSEENDRKRLYEKRKEEETLNRKRAYLQRRLQEANLKETRKPLIQTTFRISPRDNRSKSQTKSKTNRMESSLFSARDQPNSITYKSDTNLPAKSRHPNHGESHSKINYSHKFHAEHRIDKFDKHLKQHPEDLETNLEELIVQFVEHSKRSWINQ